MTIAKRNINLGQPKAAPQRELSLDTVLDWVGNQDSKTLSTVWRAIKVRSDYLRSMRVGLFSIGDRVTWASPRAGKQMSGTVIGLGRVNIKVRADDNITWRVASSLLQPQ